MKHISSGRIKLAVMLSLMLLGPFFSAGCWHDHDRDWHDDDHRWHDRDHDRDWHDDDHRY